ncbi:MAG TPA: phosphoribosylanthranilate isomerase [Polyangiaceae bacterium]|nr:phosphoribosylanthranilate isomerase [Polyangiaceae bacterium]
MTRIKICGVTTADQAQACVEAGADSVGVNFVPSSVRRVDARTAGAIARAVGPRALVVAVVAGMTVDAMRALREATGVGCLQLHGDESGEDVAALLPHAYKAVRVATRDDAERAGAMPGDYVLVDAKVDGALGGTGHAFDWSLVVDLATRRRLVLAGGLTPENVTRAVEMVRPWCVDVASGVESSPGVKDPAKVRAFVEAVRAARV